MTGIGSARRALGEFSDVVAAMFLRSWTVARLGWVILTSVWEQTWAPVWSYICAMPWRAVGLPCAPTTRQRRAVSWIGPGPR